jgi:hypothetical protein
MPIQINTGTDYFVRLRGEPLGTGNNSGDSAANATAFEQWNREIGLTSDAAATTDVGDFPLLSLFKRLLRKTPSYTVNTVAELTTGLTASQQLFAAATALSRTVYISNNTNVLAYVGLGNTPTATTYTFPIAVGATVSVEWLGAVNVICAATATGKIQGSALTNV